jgi:hypothetical protein
MANFSINSAERGARQMDVLIAGNFLPFRLKISPCNVISVSHFLDSSRLSLMFDNPLLAQPLLNLQ